MTGIQKMSRLEAQLSDINQPPKQWELPKRFDLSKDEDHIELERRLGAGAVRACIDRLPEIADDLFELKHPDKKTDDEARRGFVEGLLSEGLEHGAWFHFPWSESIVRYPNKEDHQNLRTFRNKNLITNEEQERLLNAKVAVFGLSVGSNVVEQLAYSGVGGTLIMGDFDTLAPSNTNRVKANMLQVGMSKIDIASIKVSELDPYINQVHMRDGITESGLEQLAEIKPDLIFDEVDDLSMKVRLRQFAQEQKIPIVMATDLGDKVLIDVERYDIDADAKPFLGKLSVDDMELITSGSLTAAERMEYTIRILGAENVSARLFGSVGEIGKTLAGIPQLGTTASSAGATAAVVARELLLGHDVATGRHIGSLEGILSGEVPAHSGKAVASPLQNDVPILK